MSRKASDRYHNRVARQYDAIYDDPYWELHDELTWRHIKPHLPRNAVANCADLGCGTGKWGFKLLKSGYPTTFVDSSAGMVEQTRKNLDDMGNKAKKATLICADIIEMPEVPTDTFELVLAMGDPLSICSDPVRAAREFARITQTGGIVIATADNKLAFIDHFVERGNLDSLDEFIRTGKTQWLTKDKDEQFDLTTFTPASLTKLFESSGFEVLDILGKTIIPVRENRKLMQDERSIERLLKMEKDLSKDPASAGRAGHLQIVAKKK